MTSMKGDKISSLLSTPTTIKTITTSQNVIGDTTTTIPTVKVNPAPKITAIPTTDLSNLLPPSSHHAKMLDKKLRLCDVNIEQNNDAYSDDWILSSSGSTVWGKSTSSSSIASSPALLPSSESTCNLSCCDDQDDRDQTINLHHQRDQISSSWINKNPGAGVGGESNYSSSTSTLLPLNIEEKDDDDDDEKRGIEIKSTRVVVGFDDTTDDSDARGDSTENINKVQTRAMSLSSSPNSHLLETLETMVLRNKPHYKNHLLLDREGLSDAVLQPSNVHETCHSQKATNQKRKDITSSWSSFYAGEQANQNTNSFESDVAAMAVNMPTSASSDGQGLPATVVPNGFLSWRSKGDSYRWSNGSAASMTTVLPNSTTTTSATTTTSPPSMMSTTNQLHPFGNATNDDDIRKMQLSSKINHLKNENQAPTMVMKSLQLPPPRIDTNSHMTRIVKTCDGSNKNQFITQQGPTLSRATTTTRNNTPAEHKTLEGDTTSDMELSDALSSLSSVGDDVLKNLFNLLLVHFATQTRSPKNTAQPISQSANDNDADDDDDKHDRKHYLLNEEMGELTNAMQFANVMNPPSKMMQLWEQNNNHPSCCSSPIPTPDASSHGNHQQMMDINGNNEYDEAMIKTSIQTLFDSLSDLLIDGGGNHAMTESNPSSLPVTTNNTMTCSNSLIDENHELKKMLTPPPQQSKWTQQNVVTVPFKFKNDNKNISKHAPPPPPSAFSSPSWQSIPLGNHLSLPSVMMDKEKRQTPISSFLSSSLISTQCQNRGLPLLAKTRHHEDILGTDRISRCGATTASIINPSSDRWNYFGDSDFGLMGGADGCCNLVLDNDDDVDVDVDGTQHQATAYDSNLETDADVTNDLVEALRCGTTCNLIDDSAFFCTNQATPDDIWTRNDSCLPLAKQDSLPLPSVVTETADHILSLNGGMPWKTVKGASASILSTAGTIARNEF